MELAPLLDLFLKFSKPIENEALQMAAAASSKLYVIWSQLIFQDGISRQIVCLSPFVPCYLVLLGGHSKEKKYVVLGNFDDFYFDI